MASGHHGTVLRAFFPAVDILETALVPAVRNGRLIHIEDASVAGIAL
jgi:hypothetical protein